jgi:predicted transcriptional regulator
MNTSDYKLNVLKSLTKEQFQLPYNLYKKLNLDFSSFTELLDALENEGLIDVKINKIFLTDHVKQYFLENKKRLFLDSKNFRIEIPDNYFLNNNEE